MIIRYDEAILRDDKTRAQRALTAEPLLITPIEKLVKLPQRIIFIKTWKVISNRLAGRNAHNSRHHPIGKLGKALRYAVNVNLWPIRQVCPCLRRSCSNNSAAQNGRDANTAQCTQHILSPEDNHLQ